MSKENFLGKVVSRYLTRNFWKWFAIGIGTAMVLGTVVGVSVYFGTYTPIGPDPDPETSFTTRLGEEMESEIPNVVHIEIIGNATQAIHERLIWATIDQLGDSSSYSWNVSAQVMFPDEVIIFELSTAEVNQIGTGLATSINNTEKDGVYGEDPYGSQDELPNLKWVTELYLENGTVIFLYVNMEGLILYQTTTWEGNFQAVNMNMIGADVLLPESAFDTYIQSLKDIFTPYLAI
ncbi:MAG: hypothetical protein KGD64_05035 [Candidatus Heimdallarchaeota archaeon]|nr:hypothetical protein [Candidatus Heimdallarchaeota archaeon]